MIDNGWVKCPMLGCGSDAVLKMHGIGSGYYISVDCKNKKCGAKMVNKPRTSQKHPNTRLRDLKTVYESLTHCVGHDAYRSIVESYGLRALGENSFNDIKTLVYEDYHEFFSELKKDTHNNILAFNFRMGRE